MVLPNPARAVVIRKVLRGQVFQDIASEDIIIGGECQSLSTCRSGDREGVGMCGVVLTLLAEGATAPAQAQVVGGVGRWGMASGIWCRTGASRTPHGFG